jgi:hypothetical protein
MKRKQFFFEKKNQKTFIPRSTPDGGSRMPPICAAHIKVFCFFFSKKKYFLDSLVQST